MKSYTLSSHASSSISPPPSLSFNTVTTFISSPLPLPSIVILIAVVIFFVGS
ncbi:hypothetical protein Scep_005312 [Stephania cephalantha]|uniref:Transmembrane protein n=1 Tax=Stephania cephalantha TaxID=152367 RepID=A0AAP0PW87_9MAGN